MKFWLRRIVLRQYFLCCSDCGQYIKVNRYQYQGWKSHYEFRRFTCHPCELAEFKKNYPKGSKKPDIDFSSLGAELATYQRESLWRECYGSLTEGK